MTEPETAAFSHELGRVARLVHARRAAQGALAGATLGALFGAVLAGAFWALALGNWRKSAFAAVVCGAGVGAAARLYRRFSRSEVALFVDSRLGSAEVVTSAEATLGDASEMARAVRARATAALDRVRGPQLRLPVLSRFQALMVPALALTLWFFRLPLPLRAPLKAPGSALLRRSHVAGLERIEALAGTPALSERDAERLKRLAEEAKRLRADLARGLEQRDAQARAAALRDEIAELHQRFLDPQERPGLEAAVGALEALPQAKLAAKALGDGDLVAFDEQMQALANQAEVQSREAASRALDEAAKKAREKGAEKLSEMLDRQRGLFQKRQAKMRALREFAQQLESKLPPAADQDLKDLNQRGDPEAARRLGEALGDALGQLNADERKRLADALSSKLAENGGELGALDPEQQRRLADALKDPHAIEKLKDALKELARENSADADRERSLDDAERGGAEAERGLGGNRALPVPTPGPPSPGARGPAERGPSGDGPGKSAGEPGGTSGPGGAGKHDGSTRPTPGDEIRARASTRWLAGPGLATRSLGRAPGRAGETANQVGTGNLSSRSGGEVGAVEGADIPEEYREQVGRYFEP